jgi:uncharacterized protein YdhG (YjbR/CyaY superfamily)
MFDNYISQLPEDRKEPITKILELLKIHLPQGFEAQIQYSMPSYVVPHSIFPAGYHCNPSEPLPFISVASQKNFIALYHMGLYARPELHEWFINEYPKHSNYKLDMGKSCIRFKKIDAIPYNLIGELFQKMDVQEWIKTYQKAFNN